MSTTVSAITAPSSFSLNLDPQDRAGLSAR
jgi:hypothetical protein